MASFQILRRGKETWDIYRIDELWKTTHEYEIIGRVIQSEKMYYIDLPDWNTEGFTWVRQPRGYLLPKAAFKILIEDNRKGSVMQ
jgi:hypothetical protein